MVSFLQVPTPKRCAYFSSPETLPAGAEVKNEWSYTSASPIFLHGVDRDNFKSLPIRTTCLWEADSRSVRQVQAG